MTILVPGHLLLKVDAEGMAVRVSAIGPGVLLTTVVTPDDARQFAKDIATHLIFAAAMAEEAAREAVDGA